MKRIVSAIFAFVAFGVLAHGVNTNYGAVANGVLQVAPRVISIGDTVDGVTYPYPVRTANGTAAQYAAVGWLPVDWTVPVREGYIARPYGTWFVTNGVIRQRYVFLPEPDPPPRNLPLSKMRLKEQLKNMGVWSNVWAWVSADADMLSDWNDSVVFDELNPMVQTAFAAMRQMGLSDDDVEALIQASESEIMIKGQ